MIVYNKTNGRKFEEAHSELSLDFPNTLTSSMFASYGESVSQTFSWWIFLKLLRNIPNNQKSLQTS